MSIETWSAGKGATFIYTSDPDVAKFLIGIIGEPGTIYSDRDGKNTGWQFLIETDKLDFVNTQLLIKMGTRTEDSFADQFRAIQPMKQSEKTVFKSSIDALLANAIPPKEGESPAQDSPEKSP